MKLVYAFVLLVLACFAYAMLDNTEKNIEIKETKSAAAYGNTANAGNIIYSNGAANAGAAVHVVRQESSSYLPLLSILGFVLFFFSLYFVMTREEFPVQ